MKKLTNEDIVEIKDKTLIIKSHKKLRKLMLDEEQVDSVANEAKRMGLIAVSLGLTAHPIIEIFSEISQKLPLS